MPRTGIAAKCTDCGFDLVYEPAMSRFYCKHCEEIEKKEEKGEKSRDAA